MTNRAEILAEWFGVKPAAGRVCAALYEAYPNPVPLADLMAAGGQTDNGAEDSIKQLRRAMDADSIANVPPGAWRLTLAGRADCDAGLADAAERGVAA